MPQRTVLAKIKSTLPTLAPKEEALARYILQEPRKASRSTISELATHVGMSEASVTKFTKKLGYKGFRSFRTDLLAEESDPSAPMRSKIKPEDDAITIARGVFASSMRSLSDTLEMIDPQDLARAIDMLLHAHSISFFGCGGSNIVAFDAYHKFLRSPIPCQHTIDQDVQLMHAALLGKKDVAVVFTHSGISTRAIDIAHIAKMSGAKIIAITSFTGQPISREADITFISASEESGFRSESLSTRVAQLAIIDTLFAAVMFQKKGVSTTLAKLHKAIDLTKMDHGTTSWYESTD